MPGHGWLPLPLPLTGRSTELSAIRAALDAAASGNTSVVAIGGDYGVGKTRLLDAALAEAADRDFAIARATASRTDAGVPYAILADAFTPLVRSLGAATLSNLTRGTTADLARVVPAVDSGLPRVTNGAESPDDLTTRVRWHFTQFLERLATERPLVLGLDNAHWADPSSVGLVQFILRHAPHARLALLATHNPVEADPDAPLGTMLKALAGSHQLRQLNPGPIGQDDLLDLLGTAFRVPRPALADFAAALLARTLGNPFFIEETLKAIVENGGLRLVNGEWVGWTTTDFALPATVREVVLSRVAALSPPARELLDTLSAFSAPVIDGLLGDAAGLDPATFVRAANELHGRYLMSQAETTDGIECDVTHPLTRRTIYEALEPVRRRALHGGIVTSLERHYGAHADTHATELAWHCVRTGAADVVAKGRRYLVTAGRDALARHADREAATYLQHAVDLGPAADNEVVPLIEDLARVRQRLGEYDQARSLWVTALRFHEASGNQVALARVERRMGTLAMLEAEPERALVHFNNALALAQRARQRDIEVVTLGSISLALANLGRMDDAKAEVHKALAIAEASGDTVARARIERGLLELYIHTGPVDVARECGRRALQQSNASGDRALVWSTHWALGVLAGLTADADGVVAHSREAAALARELNSPSLSAHVDEILIELASASGDWAEALRLAERAIPVARAVGQRTLLPRLLVWAGTVLLNRDEVEGARAFLDESWELSRAGAGDRLVSDVHVAIVAHIGQAAFCFGTRDWARAIDFAQRGIALCDRHGIITWSVHRLLPIVGEAALWTQDYALTERAVARLRLEAPKLEHRLGLLYADAMEAYLRFVRDNDAAAIPALLGIAERGESVPYVFQAARLRRDVARLMARVGDASGASRQLRRAHDLFQQLGAQLELRLTREQMRELGLRPPQAGNGARGVLTSRERAVALMAAQDRSNKEIGAALEISWKTVSRHLESIYRKLGVDSRRGLSEVVSRMADGR